MTTINAGIIRVTILFFLWMIIVPCIAIEPAWTFTYGEREIKSVAVAPDGSSVVAGTGKVILLAKNGTLLASEPFGEIIAQSRDGSTIVSTYSSVVSSTVYLFKKKTDASGNLVLQKTWETTRPDLIGSFAVSDKGDRIVFSMLNEGIYIYSGNTGKRLGHSDTSASLIAISADGVKLAGSTNEGLRVYNYAGTIIKKYYISPTGKPNSFLMSSDGSKVVYNVGPHIIAFNLNNGTEFWRERSSGNVNMLAMTPSGSKIVAGIENGAIEFYDAKGNLTWTYSNNGTGSRQAIKAVALTRDGSKIIAGSVEGKIILLDSTGNLLWTYDTAKDPIQQVAIAADGSLAVAAGGNTLYAFSGQRGSQPKGVGTSIKTPLPTGTSEVASVTSPEPRGTPDVIQTTLLSSVPATPAVTLTEYSVIQKKTQSPVDEITIIMALMITAFFALRKTIENG
jgi:WD40 repeat protein